MNWHDLFEINVAMTSAAMVISALVAFFAGCGIANLFTKGFRRSGSPLAGSVKSSFELSGGLLASGLVAKLLLESFEMPGKVESVALPATNGIVLLGSVMLAYGVWDILCDKVLEEAQGLDKRAQKLLIPVTRKLVRFCILTAGLVIALGVFGVNVVGVVAGLGIGGIVVALAAKDSVENVFGSITVLFDMPFALGDWVKIGTVEGVVEEINLRSTRIRTFEDSVITLPNSNLIKASVENFGARRFRRQRFTVRFGFGSKPETIDTFCRDLRAYLGGLEKIDLTRTYAELNDFQEQSAGVLVQAFFVVDTFSEEVRMRHDLMLEILRLAREQGLHFIGVTPPPELVEQAASVEAD